MCAATYVADSHQDSGRAGPGSPPARTCPSLLTHRASWTASPTPAPACLADLHLDEVIDAASPGDFQRAVWHTPLADLAEVQYRQDVVGDLRGQAIRRSAQDFEAAVAGARRAISAKADAHYLVPAELDLLEAIRRFTAAVTEFSARLADLEPRSEGLRGMAAHLGAYVHGRRFGELSDGCAALLAELRGSAVELGIQSGTVWVDEDSGRSAWTERIESFFSRFSSEASAQPSVAVPARPRRYLNHVEAQAIGLVAGLRPAEFERLHRFATVHAGFLPAELERLAEELRFFLGFLKVADRLSGAGVRWSVPRLLPNGTGPVGLTGFVDLALALKARPGDAPLVPNDLALAGDERIAFVTGPNQGGKTTFARAVGQVAYLASLGLPVAASSASLPLHTPVLTHFPRPDDPGEQRGGLADELVRLREVLLAADGSALLVLNELFSATSAEDALELSQLVVPRFSELGCRVLWVTFLEDLVTSVGGAASLVGQVAKDDPTRPTFTFRPQPPDGRSHAAALAARHGLSSEDLERRLR